WSPEIERISVPRYDQYPLSFIRHNLRLILLSLIHNTFTNMRSRKEHVGNGIETIALPMNFACLWYRL
ncbi:hypothetical protein, partial [Nostoc sp. NMS2]|uniref:hypothetical protein n=1 Tax=Nostoc sp. NMS2 TaxID=2815389 RepID=UPI0025DF9849